MSDTNTKANTEANTEANTNTEADDRVRSKPRAEEQNACGPPGTGCYRCGKTDHFVRECPEPPPLKKSRQSDPCYYCGKLGHFSAECPQQLLDKHPCFFCKEVGHWVRDCPSRQAKSPPVKPATSPGVICFRCNHPGHIARDCPQRPTQTGQMTQTRQTRQTSPCFHCNEIGHWSTECPTYLLRTRPCYRCGKLGHWSKNCPQKKQGIRVHCSICGSPDHQRYECPFRMFYEQDNESELPYTLQGESESD